MTFFLMGYFGLAAILILNLVIKINSKPKKTRKIMTVNSKSSVREF